MSHVSTQYTLGSTSKVLRARFLCLLVSQDALPTTPSHVAAIYSHADGFLGSRSHWKQCANLVSQRFRNSWSGVAGNRCFWKAPWVTILGNWSSKSLNNGTRVQAAASRECRPILCGDHRDLEALVLPDGSEKADSHQGKIETAEAADMAEEELESPDSGEGSDWFFLPG